jgi:FlaA1/EpsC-like NDP-sugar epimerase
MSSFLNRIIKSIPRWIVLLIDLILIIQALIIAYVLRFNFELNSQLWKDIAIRILPLMVLYFSLFFYFKTYAGILKFTSIQDVKRIFKASTGAFIFLLVTNAITRQLGYNNFIPYSVLVILYFTGILFMSAFRILVKILHVELNQLGREKTNVVIYGAGQAGEIANRTITQDQGTSYRVVGFVDDNPTKSKNTIDGIKIYNAATQLETLIKEKKVEVVIIAIQNISQTRKSEILETCLSLGVQVRTVPPVFKWINGELSFNQIKDISIDEVLGRDPIEINTDGIRNELADKVILVTGAAGSIGSEISRQISCFRPKKLILLDQAESALYDVHLELNENAFKTVHQSVLADITSFERIEKVFLEFKPEIVFHAAAYKHVPMMEENPSEAILNNVFGTKVLADLSVKNGVKKFVMVSTDKAVNPTNIMGASKRIAEIYTQSLNHDLLNIHGTKFITTRFGNVLGSSGSVIPRFKKQIMERGPITVTHPEIRRYFMTIPEATHLVLEAGAMGKGGEIFLFDMGDSIKIVDLAKKMIKISGLTLGRDIQIVYTGLRPGEKLYEELLNDLENTLPTHHPKIMIAKVRQYEFERVRKDIHQLMKMMEQSDIESIVLKMKNMVPEFVSQNSPFEKFDKKEIKALG